MPPRDADAFLASFIFFALLSLRFIYFAAGIEMATPFARCRRFHLFRFLSSLAAALSPPP